jgi:hypothetical protein
MLLLGACEAGYENGGRPLLILASSPEAADRSLLKLEWTGGIPENQKGSPSSMAIKVGALAQITASALVEVACLVVVPGKEED